MGTEVSDGDRARALEFIIEQFLPMLIRNHPNQQEIDSVLSLWASDPNPKTPASAYASELAKKMLRMLG